MNNRGQSRHPAPRNPFMPAPWVTDTPTKRVLIAACVAFACVAYAIILMGLLGRSS